MKKILSASLLFACSITAHGSLLLAEDFSGIELGSLNGQNGWTAVTGVTVVEGGLSYTNKDIHINGGNKHALWSTGINNQLAAYKSFTNTTSGDIWFSFTMQVVQTDKNSRFWFYVSNNEGLANSGVVGQVNNGSDAFYSGYRVNTTQYASSPVSMPTETAFIVAKLSKSTSGSSNYDQMEMWINPDSVSLSGGIIAHNTTGFNVDITTFGIAALTSGSGSSVRWGNLLIGTDQASVLDVYNVPEPATSAAIAAALVLVCIGFKRRFRQKKCSSRISG